MMTKADMTGRMALVTGGSRGIGRAICLELASRGADVVVDFAGNAQKAANVVDECHALGVQAVAIQADVSCGQQAKELMDKAVDKFGHLDILVNNAGITRDALAMRMSDEDFDEVIRTNLRGTFQCVKHASALMMRQRYGRIVSISSVVGMRGNVGQVNYAASKAGIIGMTKSLAKEVGRRGVTVNAVAPGFIATDMTANLPEKAVQQMSDAIALSHLGTPEDVARAVAFLASDDAAYVSGQVLAVDGCMSL